MKRKANQGGLRTKRLGRLSSWARESIAASADPLKEAEAAQIAALVVNAYGGPPRLKRLMELFENGTYINVIASEFGVTKQRVSQWRRALGHVEEKFTPRSLVQQMLDRGAE